MKRALSVLIFFSTVAFISACVKNNSVENDDPIFGDTIVVPLSDTILTPIQDTLPTDTAFIEEYAKFVIDGDSIYLKTPADSLFWIREFPNSGTFIFQRWNGIWNDWIQLGFFVNDLKKGSQTGGVTVWYKGKQLLDDFTLTFPILVNEDGNSASFVNFTVNGTIYGELGDEHHIDGTMQVRNKGY